MFRFGTRIRGSKQCGMDILPIFSIEIGVQPSYVNGFFGLSGDLRGMLVYNAKIRDGLVLNLKLNFTFFQGQNILNPGFLLG